MDKTQLLIERLGRGNQYNYTDLLKKISPQSSTASYIFMDLSANGIIQEIAPVEGRKMYRVII